MTPRFGFRPLNKRNTHQDFRGREVQPIQNAQLHTDSPYCEYRLRFLRGLVLQDLSRLPVLDLQMEALIEAAVEAGIAGHDQGAGRVVVDVAVDGGIRRDLRKKRYMKGLTRRWQRWAEYI